MAAKKNTDPRKIGGTYRGGYWNETYTVLAISFEHGWLDSITVRGEDGSVRTHATAWDPKRDSVVREPANA